MGFVHISSKGCHNLWRCVVPSNWPTGKLSSCSLHPGCCCSAPLRHLPRDCQAVWLCKLYIGSVRKTISGESKVTQRIKTTHWTTAKTKHSVVLQVYKWKRSRFKSLNFGRGRNMKKKQVKHVFFQFVGLGNLKISGRFRATSPTWSSWHSLPGRKLQGPRSTREINRSSEFLPSSFRKSINSVHPKGTPQISPRLASLLAILPWTRHLCRPCHIASNSQPLPAHRRTVPLSLSLVKGTDTWNWALCCHHLTGLNFLEMLYQFILRGAVVLQFAIKKSF